MDDSELFNLSPLDGRYGRITTPLRDYFSESSLIRYRLQIEIKYLFALSRLGIIRKIKSPERPVLIAAYRDTPLSALKHIKALETETHHDVKAIEYYLRDIFQKTSLQDLIPFIHFALTSEDVNNLAYRLMVKDAHEKVILPNLIALLSSLASLISQSSSLAMLARTHGQPAIPTTLGKEIAVFAIRLLHQIQSLTLLPLTGKLNGAIGGFHAHIIAYPDIDWLKFSDSFIQNLGLSPNHYTTQINSPDDLIRLFQAYHLLNSVLIGLCQDFWRYISDDWLIQKGKLHTVGSSTMPQKVNPIEFENAEGNLILANGLFEILIRKLPVSRLQRDLSDSTVIRNIGVAYGHCLLAYTSLQRGLKTINPDKTAINNALNANFAILGEALQTVLRKKGKTDAYESVASVFKQKVIAQSAWRKLVRPLAPELTNLTPLTYLGLSEKLALAVAEKINLYCRGK